MESDTTQNAVSGKRRTVLLGFKDLEPVVVEGEIPKQPNPPPKAAEEKKTGQGFILLNGKRVKVLSMKKIPDGLLAKSNLIANDKFVRPHQPTAAAASLKSEMAAGVQQAPKMANAGGPAPDTKCSSCHQKAKTMVDQGCQTEGSDLPVLDLDFDTYLNEAFQISYTVKNPKVTPQNRDRIMFWKDMQACRAVDRNGNLPIHRAIWKNDLETVRRQVAVLLAVRENINVLNGENYTPLQLAVTIQCHVDIIKYLLEKGADFRRTDPGGNTIIHIAVTNNDTKVLEALCQIAKDKKYDLDEFNDDGMTGLMLACINRDIECAKLLLAYNASPNRTDKKSGRTALFHAAENHDSPMVQLLMEHNADTRIRNFVGTSPHDAMFEMDDVPKDIRDIICSSAKRKRETVTKEVKCDRRLKTIKTFKHVTF